MPAQWTGRPAWARVVTMPMAKPQRMRSQTMDVVSHDVFLVRLLTNRHRVE
jgi:hypothetical protein